MSAGTVCVSETAVSTGAGEGVDFWLIACGEKWTMLHAVQFRGVEFQHRTLAKIPKVV